MDAYLSVCLLFGPIINFLIIKKEYNYDFPTLLTALEVDSPHFQQNVSFIEPLIKRDILLKTALSTSKAVKSVKNQTFYKYILSFLMSKMCFL